MNKHYLIGSIVGWGSVIAFLACPEGILGYVAIAGIFAGALVCALGSWRVTVSVAVR
jgi:hypothetical protein